MKKENRRLRIAKIKFFILVFFILFLILSSIYLYHTGFDVKKIMPLIEGRYGPILFIALYVVTLFIPLPFAPQAVLGPILFFFYQAVIYTLVGSLIYSILMFYIARFFGREFVDFWVSKNETLKKVEEQFKNKALKDMILVRLFFLIPSELINILAGLSRISFKNYFLGTLLGNAPVIFFTCAIIRGQIRGDLFAIAVGFVGLGLCLIIPLLFIPKLRKFFRMK